MFLSIHFYWEWLIITQFLMASILVIDIIRHRMEIKTKLVWSFIVLFGTLPGIFLYLKIGRTGKYK